MTGRTTPVPTREKDALLRIWMHLTERTLTPSQRSIILSRPETRELRKLMTRRGQNWVSTHGRVCLRAAKNGGSDLRLADWLRQCQEPASLPTHPVRDYGGAPDPQTRKVIKGLRPPMQYGDDT